MSLRRSMQRARERNAQQAATDLSNLDLLLFMSTDPKGDTPEARQASEESRDRLRTAFMLAQSRIGVPSPHIFFAGLLQARVAYDRASDGPSPFMKMIDDILYRRQLDHGMRTCDADFVKKEVDELDSVERIVKEGVASPDGE